MYINSQDANISFTQEECKDNKLAFLDVEIHVSTEGELSTVVYSKPTHTNQYLHFESHHPLVHKLSVIRTLFHRAETVIRDPVEKDKEKEDNKQALAKCSYPKWSFTKAVFPTQQKDKSSRKRNSNQTPTKNIVVTISYVLDLSDKKKLFLVNMVSPQHSNRSTTKTETGTC